MQRLLLGGLIASLGLWMLPAQAQQVTNTQVGALVEALRQAAPKTGEENDGLYSEWQLTPDIIRKVGKCGNRVSSDLGGNTTQAVLTARRYSPRTIGLKG